MCHATAPFALSIPSGTTPVSTGGGGVAPHRAPPDRQEPSAVTGRGAVCLLPERSSTPLWSTPRSIAVSARHGPRDLRSPCRDRKLAGNYRPVCVHAGNKRHALRCMHLPCPDQSNYVIRWRIRRCVGAGRGGDECVCVCVCGSRRWRSPIIKCNSIHFY